ncbi:hypothetical protein [Streptomyces ziwulingensis]|uniref:hypothetical protein n=1 Tax=Streptomyces ziwulingensis TaxID=1045501 RepID=UPI0031EA165D
MGALAGDERGLGWRVWGETLLASAWWFVLAAALLAGLGAVHHAWGRHGSRAFSLSDGRDKALCGRYTRVGGPGTFVGSVESHGNTYLEVETDAGRVCFRSDLGKRGLPAVLERQELSLCWDARRGARGWRVSPKKTPAVLVFDTGLVVHGMLSVEQDRALNDRGATVEEQAPTGDMRRAFSVFSVRSRPAGILKRGHRQVVPAARSSGRFSSDLNVEFQPLHAATPVSGPVDQGTAAALYVPGRPRSAGVGK